MVSLESLKEAGVGIYTGTRRIGNRYIRSHTTYLYLSIGIEMKYLLKNAAFAYVPYTRVRISRGFNEIIRTGETTHRIKDRKLASEWRLVEIGMMVIVEHNANTNKRGYLSFENNTATGNVFLLIHISAMFYISLRRKYGWWEEGERRAFKVLIIHKAK